MKVLILDNYDSFTHNLYQYVGELLQAKLQRFVLDVRRNDAITVREIRQERYSRIIVSPGPGDPSDPTYFGVCAQVLTDIGRKVPTLGVCLGMQGMAYYFGGGVIRAQVPMHGKTSIIRHDGRGVFRELPQNLEVMRYHSLVADSDSIPDSLKVTATIVPRKKEGVAREIMGLRHKVYPIEGVQFHPESFATEGGKQMLNNFLFRRT